jgi:NADH-quinone oxidoreductase subunit N
MGFVLLNNEGIGSILFYILVYMAMNLGAFLVVVALSSKIDSDDLRQYRGLIYRSPLAASLLAIFMLSLTGIPGFGGFISKLYVFKAAVHAGLYWLVIVAVINSVISFVYYGGVVKRMMLEEGTTKDPIRLPALSRALLAVLAIAVIILGLYWAPFAEISETADLFFEKLPVALR